MEFIDYQEEAMLTKTYGQGSKIIYPTLGLCGESGEVAEKIKKVLRDSGGEFTEEKKEEIIKELGDVLWYITAIATDLGYDLETVAALNVSKVLSRRERGKIHGEGDNR